MMLIVRDDRVSPLDDAAPTVFDIVRLGVRGGSSGGMSLTSLSLSDNIRRRLSGVSLSETVTCHKRVSYNSGTAVQSLQHHICNQEVEGFTCSNLGQVIHMYVPV